ncbi:MAG: hypothetical protein JWR88_1215, partial [Pseudonocardia sp.]|nr:hypothetical protein [Pseudonocardia sp.]
MVPTQWVATAPAWAVGTSAPATARPRRRYDGPPRYATTP